MGKQSARSIPLGVSRGRIGRFRDRLLDWYGDQPPTVEWRHTREPFAILVSEVMLQQTQAVRVGHSWRLFMQRFPDARTLADAPLGEVLIAWDGLGYHRRARNLHACAQTLVERHGGEVPRDLAALRALPGVGDYTARAVLTFAFGVGAAPVDTNVARVLARACVGTPLARAEAQSLADRCVPLQHPARWASAVMALGARVCTARRPRCAECPLASLCAWRRAAAPEDPAATGAHRPRPQPRFQGSDRYHRGRLLAALRQGSLDREAMRPITPGVDSQRIADSLVGDGLAEWDGLRLRLPAARPRG